MPYTEPQKQAIARRLEDLCAILYPLDKFNPFDVIVDDNAFMLRYSANNFSAKAAPLETLKSHLWIQSALLFGVEPRDSEAFLSVEKRPLRLRFAPTQSYENVIKGLDTVIAEAIEVRTDPQKQKEWWETLQGSKKPGKDDSPYGSEHYPLTPLKHYELMSGEWAKDIRKISPLLSSMDAFASHDEDIITTYILRKVNAAMPKQKARVLFSYTQNKRDWVPTFSVFLYDEPEPKLIESTRASLSQVFGPNAIKDIPGDITFGNLGEPETRHCYQRLCCAIVRLPVIRRGISWTSVYILYHLSFSA